MNAAAGLLNLDMEKFTSCVNSGAAYQKVLSDMELGNRLGLKGTPTFFIGGQELVGPQTFDTFKSVLDKQLAS
jgi:protein-disulfide isomerase